MFESLSQSLSHIFSKITGRSAIDEKTLHSTLERVKDALLHADVPYDTAEAFCEQVRSRVAEYQLDQYAKPAEQLMHIVHTQLAQFLGQDAAYAQMPSHGVVTVMGLQGSGKTTTTVKLARHMMYNAETHVLVGSVDFYRPAAIEQLRAYAQKADVATYQASSSEPVAAAQEIVTYARKAGYDLILLDTAGRLHVSDEMIQQMQDIQAQVKPDYSILVLDAMTGQSSLEVARSFKTHVGFDAGILTKMDSDTRGGAAFAFRYVLDKPIIYTGAGEKVADLEPFKPDRVARRMLDMGDLLTLSEKAQEKIQEREAESMQQRMQRGEFTLEDFAQQLQMMRRIGSFRGILQYMPGASSLGMSDDAMANIESELSRFRVMMNSMTQKERNKPSIINRSRRERIARGSGVRVADVQQLLDRFKQSQQMMKMMNKMGGLQQLFQS